MAETGPAGGVGRVHNDSSTRQSSKACGGTDQKVLWDGEGRNPVCLEELGESRCSGRAGFAQIMRERGVSGYGEQHEKGDRSGDVEQVGGQDRWGWAFARSLNKHTLRVYSTLTPSEALEYRASKRHRKHLSWPRGRRKVVQGGRDWSWGCKGEGKSARWTRVGTTFQTEGTASGHSF